ncbi:hypothetical protein [Martelella sp. HB161492]|uniref:hypothetical protein n=1 Tax=Martelella sp. HB161492 TaxID=2720726 RepID=UPI001592433E|nr:hypothetical protein [Martelella sp. HB161492]
MTLATVAGETPAILATSPMVGCRRLFMPILKFIVDDDVIIDYDDVIMKISSSFYHTEWLRSKDFAQPGARFDGSTAPAIPRSLSVSCPRDIYFHIGAGHSRRRHQFL